MPRRRPAAEAALAMALPIVERLRQDGGGRNRGYRARPGRFLTRPTAAQKNQGLLELNRLLPALEGATAERRAARGARRPRRRARDQPPRARRPARSLGRRRRHHRPRHSRRPVGRHLHGARLEARRRNDPRHRHRPARLGGDDRRPRSGRGRLSSCANSARPPRRSGDRSAQDPRDQRAAHQGRQRSRATRSCCSATRSTSAR